MSNVSLQEMLQRRTPPAKPLQLAILRQIAAQLDEAHHRRLVHGNLNPQNILLSEPGPEGGTSVFVKGFGGRFDMDPGALSGPPPAEAYYLSPEQVLGIDPRSQSDEFSFAAIAYELIAGTRPFTAAKLSGLIFAICSDPPRPIDTLDTGLTAGVTAVLNRALAKDPQARFQRCGEFAAALENELVRSDSWKPPQAVSEPRAVAAAAAVPQPEPNAATTVPAAVVTPQVEANGFQIPAFQTRPQAEERTTVPGQTGPVGRFPEPRPFIPVQEPPAAAARTAYDLPPVRRRNRYGDDERATTGSPVKKFAIAGLVLFGLAGAAMFFFGGSPKSDLPTQVLDTKNAPVSPPPAKDDSAQAQVPAPSQTAGSTSTPAQQHPLPAPAHLKPQTGATQSQASQSPASQSPSGQSRGAQSVPAAPAMQTQSFSKSAPSATTGPPSTTASHELPGSGLVDVELLSEPPGANVIIDNNSSLTCKAPCNISLSGGRHTLSASLSGYTLAQRIFNIPETTSVFVTMPRLTGALVVTSNPSAATILIDGQDFGLTPATLHLPPGQHRVTLMNGSQRHDEEVTVVADGIQATGYTFTR